MTESRRKPNAWLASLRLNVSSPFRPNARDKPDRESGGRGVWSVANVVRLVVEKEIARKMGRRRSERSVYIYILSFFLSVFICVAGRSDREACARTRSVKFIVQRSSPVCANALGSLPLRS